MQAFAYSYPTKVYFGEGAAASALAQELPKAGRTVLLAYGGGSIKRSGIYDQLKGLLEQAGKEVVEFSGIMANPTYAKAQEGAALAVIQLVYYRHILKDAPEKFARFAQVVFGRQTAEEGLEVLSAFIGACGLPTKLGQLRSNVEITPALLRQVADSCNLIRTNPRTLTHDEVYQILCECL